MSIPATWMKNDQIELIELRNAPIKMADTSYGCFLVPYKRDMEPTYQKMYVKEKADLTGEEV